MFRGLNSLLEKENISIGKACEYILNSDQNLLRWDSQLESMYQDSYKPNSYPVLSEPTGSTLLDVFSGYMNHNGFGENFFPFQEPRTGNPKAIYAANLMNLYHDFIHAICEYESSDEDEMRLESFMMGQNPLGFGIFFSYCMKHPDINEQKYSHLRDVWHAKIYLEDFYRGQAAHCIIAHKLEDMIHTNIDTLRSSLNIASRKTLSNFANTCGLKTSEPFFSGR